MKIRIHILIKINKMFRYQLFIIMILQLKC